MREAWMASFLALAAAAAAAAPPQALRLGVGGESEVRVWDARIDQLVRSGGLRVARSEADTLLPGRVHERFTQLHGGVPVFGGEIVRQSDGAGTVSLFGSYYEGIGALSAKPVLSAEQAAARVEALAGHPALGPAELFVFPHRDGDGFALTWRTRAFDGETRYAYFVDAATGALVHRVNDRPTQAPSRAAVGVGRGVLDDAKKMSAEPMGGGFGAFDRLRPSPILTLDFQGNSARAVNLFFFGRGGFTDSDIARDADNDWRDGAVVDAHTYAGWTYDYYFKRLGRRGLDNADGAIVSVVHPARREDVARQTGDVVGAFYVNAFYDTFYRAAVFGEGLPPQFRLRETNQQVNYFAGALDVVAHELTHGVTDFTSNLVYEDEPGALNEAFSDMMGTAVEFFFQEPGSGPLRADYLLGEDIVTPGGFRSMASPTVWGHPDHYSLRLVSASCDAENDFCDVHKNSGIPNHAYYLAIEGGRNRVSGLSVQGVGAANREQIEKVFYRAFTLMLPSTANFTTARAATIQSARDLYGAGSAPERAVMQAWAAVGLP